MSKLILSLLLLLHFYNCQDLDNARIFEIPRKASNEVPEFKVRKGEIFGLKFYSNPSTGYSWNFLNKDEVSDSLLFIKSKFVPSKSYYPRPLIGAGGNLYYYFKGLEITNETKDLKFSYNRFGKTNGLQTQIVKITIY